MVLFLFALTRSAKMIELAPSVRRELVATIKTPSKIRSHIESASTPDSMHVCCTVPRRYIPQSDNVGHSNACTTLLLRSRHVGDVVVFVGSIARCCCSSSTLGQTLLARGASRTALFFLFEHVA
jgi:hypothetical protein